MRLDLIGFGSVASPSRYVSRRFTQSSHFMTKFLCTVPHAAASLRARDANLFSTWDRKACDLRNLFVTPLMQHLQREHHALVVIELCQRSLHYLIEFFIKELIHRHGRLIA